VDKLEEDLRATSDELVGDTKALQELEVEKRRTPASSSRFVALAQRTRQLAARVRRLAGVQAELGEQAQGKGISPLEERPSDAQKPD
jgi:hypothetical protein